MVALASSLNPLQERNTGFVPTEIYDVKTVYAFHLTHDLVCISFNELTSFKQQCRPYPISRIAVLIPTDGSQGSLCPNQSRVIAPATLPQHSSTTYQQCLGTIAMPVLYSNKTC